MTMQQLEKLVDLERIQELGEYLYELIKSNNMFKIPDPICADLYRIYDEICELNYDLEQIEAE